MTKSTDTLILTRGRYMMLAAFDWVDEGEGATTSEAVRHLEDLNENVSLPHASSIRKRLQKDSLLQVSEVERRRYKLTREGRDVLMATAEEFQRLAEMTANKCSRKIGFKIPEDAT